MYPVTLDYFMEFLERNGTEIIATELAPHWAMEYKGVQKATWARQIILVIQFRPEQKYRSPSYTVLR